MTCPIAANGVYRPAGQHLAAAEADRNTAALYAFSDRDYGRPHGVRW